MNTTWINESAEMTAVESLESIGSAEHPVFERARRDDERRLRRAWGACIASVLSLIPCLMLEHSLLPYLFILAHAVYGLLMFRSWVQFQLPETQRRWIAHFPWMVATVSVSLSLHAWKIIATW